VTINPVTVKPHELKPDDMLGFKIIAVIGASGKDWAAYRGLTNWDDERVAREGDKVDQEVAEGLFYAPTVMGFKYRP
jgi:hypothetical protein